MNTADIVVLVLTGLTVAGGLAALVVYARRLSREQDRLRLLDLLQQRDRVLPRDGSAAAMRDAAVATRRCMGCAHHDRCDALLIAKDWNTLREICPNATYVESLPRTPSASPGS